MTQYTRRSPMAEPQNATSVGHVRATPRRLMSAEYCLCFGEEIGQQVPISALERTTIPSRSSDCHRQSMNGTKQLHFEIGWRNVSL